MEIKIPTSVFVITYVLLLPTYLPTLASHSLCMLIYLLLGTAIHRNEWLGTCALVICSQ